MEKRNVALAGTFLILIAVIAVLAYTSIIRTVTLTSAFASEEVPPSLYMTIERGEGTIQGDVTEPGMEGTIQVFGLNHQMSEGIAAGERSYLAQSRLTVETRVGMHTPKLYEALSTGEYLTVIIRWYELDPDTQEILHYFTIKLEDAIVASIKQSSVERGGNLVQIEEISFTYSGITITHELEELEWSL